MSKELTNLLSLEERLEVYLQARELIRNEKATYACCACDNGLSDEHWATIDSSRVDVYHRFVFPELWHYAPIDVKKNPVTVVWFRGTPDENRKARVKLLTAVISNTRKKICRAKKRKNSPK